MDPEQDPQQPTLVGQSLDGTGFASVSKRLPRFWVPALSAVAPGQAVDLGPDEARHAVKVLRLAVGRPVLLFDGQGHQAVGPLVSVHKNHTSVRVEDLSAAPPPACKLWVATAVPKGDRAETMVDQLSQMGVDHWLPLEPERGVVSLADGNKSSRLERRAMEACKQCGRLWPMRIHPSQTPFEAMATAPVKHWFWMDVDGPLLDAKQAWAAAVEKTASANPAAGDAVGGAAVSGDVGLLVGPEGGWTDEERQRFVDAGVQAFHLPMPVLRIETAAVAGAAVLLQHRPGG